MTMKWPAREGLLLLGGILFAFGVWVPIVINVLPQLAGRETGPWEWGVEHLPGFFGTKGARHAVMSWIVALFPYAVMQVARLANWGVRLWRRQRGLREVRGGMPDHGQRETAPSS